MAKIAIVTDSTAYLPEEEAQKKGIAVVPLTVNFEDDSIIDGNKNSKEFFDRVEKASKIPFTSQPSVGQFVETYDKLLKEGKEIISIHISSKLSGTIESASGAAKMLDAEKISLVDSLHTSAGLAFLVRAAADWVAEGLSREEIVARLEKEKKNIQILFVPDTLDYLKKGGRIGGGQALLGTLLQIRPILHLEEGKVEILDKVRTKKKAVQRIIQEIPKESERIKITVLHVLSKLEAEEVKKLVLKEVPQAQVDIDELGPVISIHVGPRVIGMVLWDQG